MTHMDKIHEIQQEKTKPQTQTVTDSYLTV